MSMQMDIVNVKNTGTVDLLLMWNNQKFRLRAGETLPVSSEAVVTWFGDPSQGNLPDNPARANEHRRIAMKYGAFNAPDHTFTPFPSIEVWSTEGARIYTPMEDPDGELMSGAGDGVITSNTEEALRTILDRLSASERETAALKLMLAEKNMASTDTVAGDDVDTTDTPDTPPAPSLTDTAVGGQLARALDDSTSDSGAPVDKPSRVVVGGGK